MNKMLRHRFGPLLILLLLVSGISFVIRLILLFLSWSNTEMNPLKLLGIFLVGFFYDLVVWSFFSIPLSFYCWLMKDGWYRSKWNRVILYTFFVLYSFILLLNACSEIAFWQEFSVQYNFIAVDYLFYTTEVLENIWQSYNIPMILAGVLASVIILVVLIRKKIFLSQQVIMRFKQRSYFFMAWLLLPVAGYFLVSNAYKNISSNRYVNELSGNGIYEFGHAFWNNEIDYNQFYLTRSDTANFALLRKLLWAPNVRFGNDSLSVEREIHNDSPERKWNLVLISVESLSADYMARFGNQDNITPYLDSLAGQSLFFDNFYATGTRTVRGLEALSLAIPPTPGQSIVRRPGNEDMFTMGNVLKNKGYEVNYIYGGKSFFDNMGYFFSHNGYKVLDKSDIPDSFVHHTTAWGIDDEGSFDFMLKQCDQSYHSGKLFFNHLMTVSNHTPYTYPEGRIDIPPTVQSINGGVKYTDFAIHKFLQDARKRPWFDSTLFIIVADHCSKSAGKTDLPVNRYHIPCFIYGPALVYPKTEKRLTSQADLVPTVFGLMNLSYLSRFMGYDLYKTPAGRERVFISTYQDMGYLKDGKLLVLSPQKKSSVFIPDLAGGIGTRIKIPDSLLNEAIAWYQGASFLFRNKKYNSNK